MAVSIKRGDTLPNLSITCTDWNGALQQQVPVDLTTASAVKVIGQRAGAPLFSRTVTGTNAGVVTMPWQAPDTAAAGVIQIEVEVTWPGGAVQTFPADSYLSVYVVADLG